MGNRRVDADHEIKIVDQCRGIEKITTFVHPVLYFATRCFNLLRAGPFLQTDHTQSFFPEYGSKCGKRDTAPRVVRQRLAPRPCKTDPFRRTRSQTLLPRITERLWYGDIGNTIGNILKRGAEQ